MPAHDKSSKNIWSMNGGMNVVADGTIKDEYLKFIGNIIK